jgi:BASS family bile acid:Na+ symporter
MLNKIIKFYTRYFSVWVVIFAVIAYLYPSPFVAMKGLTEWFFALTMFGIGVVLSPEDFKRVLLRPVIILIGSCCQFTIMPIGAFLIAKIFNLPPELTVGLILTGSAPGAMASNVMSYIAKADPAYSVSLTTVSTLLCPILTPLLTLLLAGEAFNVSFWAMVFTVVKMVIIPLLAGFALRQLLKDKIHKFLEIFPAISVTFIIFICALVIALNKEYLHQVTALILLVTVILNFYGTIAGYSVGKLFKMGKPQRRTLAIEIGMQNAGLGTVLALKHFGQKAAIPAAIFVFVCIITASVLSAVWQRYDGFKRQYTNG